MSQISNIYSGKGVCLDKANIDTDQIIPKQFLKSIKKTGLGPFLFDSWRYEDEGFLGGERGPGGCRCRSFSIVTYFS